jgi:glycosyltransferase involved in cell wall biosynthesis
MARAQISAAIARANPPDPVEAEKRIRIFIYPWPDDCLSSLLHRADCYVSLHRGEGWCYPLFDAASLGVPVVATGYSGPMDYLDSRHHRLVGYSMTAANKMKHTIRFGFDSSMSWAEPDLVHAAEQLRAVYEDRAAALALEAAARIRAAYSFEAVGQMARHRFLALGQQVEHLEQVSRQGAVDCATSAFQESALTIPGTVSDSPLLPSFCN